MRTKRAILLICGGLIATFAAQSFGGGPFAALGRYLRPGSYETHRKCNCGYPDCQMSWQPIKSRFHPAVLPPGMKNFPRPKPRPGIIPKTPQWWRPPAKTQIIRPAPARQLPRVQPTQKQQSTRLQPVPQHQHQPVKSIEAPRVQRKSSSRRSYGRHADVRYRGTRARTASHSH